MIQATFTVSASDFNDEIIEKIKSYLEGQHAMVTISIQTEPAEAPQKETKERVKNKLLTLVPNEVIPLRAISIKSDELLNLGFESMID